MNVWGFLAIALLLTGLIHLYLWFRLVRGTGTGRRWRRTGGAVLAGAAVVTVVTLIAEPALHEVSGWLTAPGYVWLGVLFYLLTALVVLEVPVLVTGAVWRRRDRRRSAASVPGHGPGIPGPAPAPAAAATPARTAAAPGTTAVAPATTASPASTPATVDREGRNGAGLDRRTLLRRGAAVLAGAAATGTAGYGVARAYLPPAVRRVPVPLDRLDPRADGLRVAVIGDLHLGPLYGAAQVERVVETVNRLDPDLVALVGDLATSEADAVRPAAEPLRRLRSRYGTYYVMGNHEYYTGHREWIEVADELGLRMLRNRRVEIAHRGGAIDLAGVNDRDGRWYDDPPDYRAALADRDPSRPVVLLAHQPVQAHRAAAYGVDLQLSGHTHGGQLAPFNLLVRFEQPVVSGLAEVRCQPPDAAGADAADDRPCPPDARTLVYVTNGAGFWGPPMRVGAEPDVSLLELRAR